MKAITVRQMPFEFADELESVFIPGEPELSFQLIAASLFLPYLEPYLIRSMRSAKDKVTDPDILKGLESFCAQEAQHYRTHMKFNNACRLTDFPELARLEKEIEGDYQRFSREKPLRFNLAYAEGFEALTMNLIRFMMENPGFDNPDSPIVQMWEWHFVEELEHRNVAFDVYDHVYGGYLYRLFIGLYAQWHFTRWIRKVNRYMLKTCPPPQRNAEERRARRKVAWSLRKTLLRKLLPDVLRIYLPNYTPHTITISPAMKAIADRYTKMAIHHS